MKPDNKNFVTKKTLEMRNIDLIKPSISGWASLSLTKEEERNALIIGDTV